MTGGSGFIGSYVVRRLVEAGDEVIIYDRAPHTDLLDRLVGADAIAAVPLVRGDVAELGELLEACRDHQVEAIAHLAYVLPSADAADPVFATRVNACGMVTVLEVARQLGLGRVAWASSLAVYGPPYDRALRDDTPLNPCSLYGALKALNEHQAQFYSELYGVDVVAVRFGGGYGPLRPNKGSPADLLRSVALGGTFRMGSATGIPWAYVDDEASALVAVLKHPGRASRLAYNLPGDVGPMEKRLAILRKLLPDLAVEMEPDVAPPWDYRADALAVEIGWQPMHTLESGFRITINSFRADAGLPLI